MPPGGSEHTEPDDEIRVLHVDDEPDFPALVKTFLERADERLDVVTASSAHDGLTVLADSNVDCVVSDYDMPERNGIEFLEAVRETHPNVPFLLFTGKGSEEIASEAISAGVTEYLQKQSGTEQYTVLANRIRNVVERERSRRALEEHNRQLETLIQNLPGMVYRCRNEPSWPMEFVGGEVEELTGYTAEQIESNEVVWGEDVIQPGQDETVWDGVQAALAEQEPFEITYGIETKQGEERIAWERGRGIFDDDGELQALEGFITDVTTRDRRGDDREHQTALLQALFEDSPDMINVHDENGTIVDANRRFCEELGYTEDEVLGTPVWELDASATEADVHARRERTAVGNIHTVDATLERHDGSHLSVNAHLTELDVEDAERFLVINREPSTQTTTG